MLKDTHLGDEPSRLVIVDTYEQGHRVELSFLQELLRAFGKERAIDGIGRAYHFLQEKIKQGTHPHLSASVRTMPQRMRP